MEVDTSASASIISNTLYWAIWPTTSQPTMLQSIICFCTYFGKEIKVLGSINVNVIYRAQCRCLSLLVIPTNGPASFGHDWLKAIPLDWTKLDHTQVMCQKALEKILQDHDSLFSDEMETLKVTQVHVTTHVQCDSVRHSVRERKPPMHSEVHWTKELQQLWKAGVVKPVQSSERVAPIVPTLKSNGYLHRHGDYRVTINQVALSNAYPLSEMHDQLASSETSQVGPTCTCSSCLCTSS